MGKKNKDKKKGKGAEKTQAKTEKKLSNKMKKELQALGEVGIHTYIIWYETTYQFFFFKLQDDIEQILNKIEHEENKRLQVVEAEVNPPSRRLNFTFIAHPEKDQLILYGGEFFNGQKVMCFIFIWVVLLEWTFNYAPSYNCKKFNKSYVANNSRLYCLPLIKYMLIDNTSSCAI